MWASKIPWLVLALGLAGCGGSSSESPWPVEPLDAEPGPFGEAPPAGDATDVAVPASEGSEEEPVDEEPPAAGAEDSEPSAPPP